jgi:hypothetical protein
MSQQSQLNPGNQDAFTAFVQDGTLAREPGAQTTVLCASRPAGVLDYSRRAMNVRAAFLLGVEKYAYSETVAKLDADVRLIVDSIWPGCKQALKVYGWSIGSGTLLFGIIGGVLGDGAGAWPGAMIGAKIGAAVASAILFFQGLRFLGEYVLTHLGEAGEHFQAGLKIAWETCGQPSFPNDAAAREFGRAMADLVSLVLQAAVAWVLKKGLEAGLEELNESDAGRALAPYAKVQYWRNQLGVTDAPIPRKGIATTIQFFESQIRMGRLDRGTFTNEAKLKSYWSAQDFSREIKVESLPAGKELIGYRAPNSPFGYYYTEVGTYLDRAGIDSMTAGKLPAGGEGAKPLVPREFIRYRGKTGSVEALKSTCSGVRAWDTKNPAAGGATQYFIPRSWEVLEPVESTVGRELHDARTTARTSPAPPNPK